MYGFIAYNIIRYIIYRALQERKYERFGILQRKLYIIQMVGYFEFVFQQIFDFFSANRKKNKGFRKNLPHTESKVHFFA